VDVATDYHSGLLFARRTRAVGALLPELVTARAGRRGRRHGAGWSGGGHRSRVGLRGGFAERDLANGVGDPACPANGSSGGGLPSGRTASMWRPAWGGSGVALPCQDV